MTGGAACLAPVASWLAKRGDVDAICLAGPAAMTAFASLGAHPEPVGAGDDADAVSLLRSFAPDVVVAGAVGSIDHGLDYRLVRAAGRLSIPRVMILDSWMHLIARFALRKGRVEPDALPEAICVMDEPTAAELRAGGVPSKLVTVTGHPLVQWLRASQEKAEPRRSSRPRWVFFSEPLSTYYKGRDDAPGYDEHEAFSLACSAASKISPAPEIVVKEHPRLATLAGSAVVQAARVEGGILFAPVQADPYALLRGADVVLGMSSSMLVWAFLLGKTVIAVQPGITPDADFNILTRRGFLRNVQSAEALRDAALRGVDQKLLESAREFFGWETPTSARCATVIDKAASRAFSRQTG